MPERRGGRDFHPRTAVISRHREAPAHSKDARCALRRPFRRRGPCWLRVPMLFGAGILVIQNGGKSSVVYVWGRSCIFSPADNISEKHAATYDREGRATNGVNIEPLILHVPW